LVRQNSSNDNILSRLVLTLHQSALPSPLNAQGTFSYQSTAQSPVTNTCTCYCTDLLSIWHIRYSLK